MALSSEQKQIVAQWVTAGDNLSAIQRKLAETFQVNLTYMDVRFLVDDLNLQLKDPVKPAPKAADVSAQAPAKSTADTEKKGFIDRMKEKVGLGGDEAAEAYADEELPPEEAALEDEALPPSGGSLAVEVDKLVLIPGALASGAVTFSDGVKAKWIIDQYGRPGLTEVSQPGYRPTPGDAQAFMQELTRLIQQPGY